MAASVAPPRLMIRVSGWVALIFGGRVRGIQSPESMTSRSEVAGAVGGRWSVYMVMRAGTEFQRVTSWVVMRWCQWAGSRLVLGRTRLPPAPRTPKMSQTERSKLREERARARSRGVMVNRWLMSRQVLDA